MYVQVLEESAADKKTEHVLEQLAELSALAAKKAKATAAAALSVAGVLEVCLVAFARLGQCGCSEDVGDEEAPHMLVLQSALTRLLVVHSGGAGDRKMSQECSAEAKTLCLRLVAVARRHARALLELSEVRARKSEWGREGGSGRVAGRVSGRVVG